MNVQAHKSINSPCVLKDHVCKHGLIMEPVRVGMTE